MRSGLLVVSFDVGRCVLSGIGRREIVVMFVVSVDLFWGEGAWVEGFVLCVRGGGWEVGGRWV
jgi:hypothetical protein